MTFFSKNNWQIEKGELELRIRRLEAQVQELIDTLPLSIDDRVRDVLPAMVREEVDETIGDQIALAAENEMDRWSVEISRR